MAVQKSIQMVEGYRQRPIENHSKLRYMYFDTGTLTVAYAQNDQIDLCRLPSGTKRILPNLSRITSSALGAARTLSIGHRQYMKRPPDNTLEAEDTTAFMSAMDVSAAVNAAAFSTVLKFDMFSLAEVDVFATIAGGTMPIGARIQGLIAYLYE